MIAAILTFSCRAVICLWTFFGGVLATDAIAISLQTNRRSLATLCALVSTLSCVIGLSTGSMAPIRATNLLWCAVPLAVAALTIAARRPLDGEHILIPLLLIPAYILCDYVTQ